MEEVDPSFVMATLICFLGTQPAERDSEASMRADVPFILGTRRFSEPHTSDHSPGTPPGHQNGEGPGGTGKFVLTNASSMMLTGRGSLFDWRRHATPLKSPATMSTCCWCITVRTASNKFFAIPCFLAYVLLMWSDIMLKNGLAISRYPPERSTGDDSL